MLRLRGDRLRIAHYYECQKYDLERGTNTHGTLRTGEFAFRPDNSDRSVGYMCSWTSELVRSFDAAREILGARFSLFTFVDIGCGKGKALLVWQEQLLKIGANSQVFGVEYYQPLTEIAIANYRLLFHSEGHIFTADATTFDYDNIGDHIIAYLYNPFDANILATFLSRISNKHALIIYNNPVHLDAIVRHGFRLVRHTAGWFPNLRTAFLANFA